MAKQKTVMNEWSHFINGDDVDKKPLRFKISADEVALKDVATRANVVSISELKADLTLEREQAGRVVHAAGRFEAKVTLECSITGDEFDMDIEEPVEGWFEDKETTVSFMKARKERDTSQKGDIKSGVEVEVASEEEDPEAMVNGKIDLGELVVQHLILAIPAYPQKEGAEFAYGDEEVVPEANSPLRKNPFEALKDWKEKR